MPARTPTRSRPRTSHLLPSRNSSNPGEVRDEPLLPSFLYIPGAKDFPPAPSRCPGTSAATTWSATRAEARRRERRPPGLLRQELALAFRASIAPRRSCPVTRARRRRASFRPSKPPRAIWSICATPGTPSMPDAPFDEQQVLVTVPASFDAVARELTLEAAEQAGYQQPHPARRAAGRLLRLARAPSRLARTRQLGDLILVVDIGGGTTDFTLIAVTEASGELELERVAVGEHILLGGDNIDLALARTVAERSSPRRARSSTRCSCRRSGSNCRVAKEKLLEPESKANEAAGHHPRPRHRPRRRHHQSQADPRAISNRCCSKASSRGCRAPTCPQRSAASASGNRPALRRRCRHHAPPGALPAPASRHRGARRRSSRPSGLACPTHVLFNGGVLHAAIRARPPARRPQRLAGSRRLPARQVAAAAKT